MVNMVWKGANPYIIRLSLLSFDSRSCAVKKKEKQAGAERWWGGWGWGLGWVAGLSEIRLAKASQLSWSLGFAWLSLAKLMIFESQHQFANISAMKAQKLEHQKAD